MERVGYDRAFVGIRFSAAHNFYELADHFDWINRGPPGAKCLGLWRARLSGVGQMAGIGIGRAQPLHWINQRNLIS